ncbi:MAG TPA: GNAT family N-acetyltransferase [Pyrinomonadaceae bacterium]
MKITETPRLILRQFTPEDAARNYEIYTDPDNMKFLGKMPESIEFERYHLQRHIDNYYKARGFGLWAVVLKETGALIGRCGLILQPVEGEEVIEVSYLIDNPFWGKGYAPEAARACLRLGFEKYEFASIVAMINPENTASVRVAEKIGMRYEKEVDFRDFGRVAMYLLKRTDFRAQTAELFTNL